MHTCHNIGQKQRQCIVGAQETHSFRGIVVVMGVTMASAIFKPEKNLVFFQDKIAGARDATLVSLSD